MSLMRNGLMKIRPLRAPGLSSPWCHSGVAPRAAMRPVDHPSAAAALGTPAGKARRLRVSGIFEGGATQPDGMQRRPTAAGVAPRAARPAADFSRLAGRPPERACVATRDSLLRHSKVKNGVVVSSSGYSSSKTYQVGPEVEPRAALLEKLCDGSAAGSWRWTMGGSETTDRADAGH